MMVLKDIAGMIFFVLLTIILAPFFIISYVISKGREHYAG